MSKHQFYNRMAKGLMKGMVNAFICPELHTTITKNVDDGFIPAEVACVQCKQPARSMLFQVNQSFKPIVEWYKPTIAEQQAYCLRLNKTEAHDYEEYIRRGNLMSRLVSEPTKFDDHATDSGKQ